MKGFEYRYAQALLAMLGGNLAAGAFAQEETVPALTDSLGLSTNLIEVTVNLALVLAAIVILAWLFRRVQGFSQPAGGSLRVTATLPLGPKERILLVQAGDEQILIGASAAGLARLHVLCTPLPEEVAEETPPGSFRDKLLKSLARSSS